MERVIYTNFLHRKWNFMLALNCMCSVKQFQDCSYCKFTLCVDYSTGFTSYRYNICFLYQVLPWFSGSKARSEKLCSDWNLWWLFIKWCKLQLEVTQHYRCIWFLRISKLIFSPYLIWVYKFFWILKLKRMSVRPIFTQVYKRICHWQSFMKRVFVKWRTCVCITN